jgi:pimeloyl-ACP methyl ester carboxylesterase
VALREALTDERVDALALMGMPLEPGRVEVPPVPKPSELLAFRRPVLLLAGEEDPHCPRPALEALGRTIPDADVAILPGTDHFLWRREPEAAEIVGAFVARVVDGTEAGRPGASPP